MKPRAQPAELPEEPAELPPRERAELRYGVSRAVPAAVGSALAAELQRRLTFTLPAAGRAPARPCRCEIFTVGGLSRGAPVLKDVDLLVAPRAPARPRFFEPKSGLLASACLCPPLRGDRATLKVGFSGGARRRSCIVGWAAPPGEAGALHVVLDLFLATPAELPFALFHLTSPRAYVIRIRAFAKKVRGWKLTQYGLFYADSGRRVRGSSRIRTQEQLAAFLGVTWRPPAARG